MTNTPVLDVKVSNDHKWLYAATVGRSILRMPLSVSVTTGAGAGSGGPGGTVPATLSLTLGATPPSFGSFAPGVASIYTASTTATVTSTAGDATLGVTDPDPANPGHLVNGSYVMAQPLQVNHVPVPGTVKSWSAPVSNDPAALEFEQPIAANDPLRTGTYSKT